jgi:hypothetical protein
MTDAEIITRLTNLQMDLMGKLNRTESDIKDAKCLDLAISILKFTSLQL